MTGENSAAVTNGNSNKSGGGSKSLIIIGAVIIILGLIVGGFIFLRKTEKKEEPTAVGAIDRDKIFDTKLFKEVNKKLDTETENLRKKYEKLAKPLDEKKEEDAKKLREYQAKYFMERKAMREKILKPAYDETRKVIASVAVQKGLYVVLDKRIVVCGSQDITDEVFKKMESGEKVEEPSEADIAKLNAKSKIGYFDQYVVASLPDFRKAQEEYQVEQAKLAKEFERIVKEKKLNDDQKKQLSLAMMEQLKKYQNDLQAPVVRKVNRTVESVGKKKNLSLIVDSESVMFGGINVTDEVADEIVGKKTTDK